MPRACWNRSPSPTPRGLTGESWSEPEICAPSRHPGLCRPRTTLENYGLIHHQASQERSFKFTPELVPGSPVPVDCGPGKYALSPSQPFSPSPHPHRPWLLLLSRACASSNPTWGNLTLALPLSKCLLSSVA